MLGLKSWASEAGPEKLSTAPPGVHSLLNSLIKDSLLHFPYIVDLLSRSSLIFSVGHVDLLSRSC